MAIPELRRTAGLREEGIGGRGIKRGALEIFRTVGPKSVIYRGETRFFVFDLAALCWGVIEELLAPHVCDPRGAVENALILHAASLAAMGEVREIR